MPLNEKTEADQKKVSKGADVVETKYNTLKCLIAGNVYDLKF